MRTSIKSLGRELFDKNGGITIRNEVISMDKKVRWTLWKDFAHAGETGKPQVMEMKERLTLHH